MPYTPTVHDIAWAKMVLNLTNEGAVWVFPDAMMAYAISHSDKTLTLSLPAFADLTPHQCDMHHRTRQTFSACGYTVLPNETGENR